MLIPMEPDLTHASTIPTHELYILCDMVTQSKQRTISVRELE